MFLDCSIILAYALAMLALGWWGMRKARNQADFLVAGRRLGPGLYLGTMAAVVLGGASTIGTVKLGYLYGLSGMWLVFMLGLGIIVLSMVLSRQIARLRVYTVTQVLEKRYQPSSRLIGAVVMVVYDLMVAVTATIAIGSITEVVFAIPRIPAIIGGGAIVIFYSVIGGMWSLTLTDIVQFVIKTIGIFLVLLPLSIQSAGGLGRMQEVLPSGFFDLDHIGLETIGSYFLLYFFGALIGQDIWQRVFTARSEAVVRYAGMGAGIYCMLYGLACALIGAAAQVLMPQLAVPENAYAHMVLEVLAPGLRGLVVAAALSAIMSTASGCLLAAATVLQEDIHARFLRPNAPNGLRESRLFTLLIGTVMLVLACLVNDVIGALSIAYNLLVGGLLVPIVGAMLWRRASAGGAIAGIVAGSLTVIAAMFRDGILASTPIAYGLLASLAAFVVFSLAGRPSPAIESHPK